METKAMPSAPPPYDEHIQGQQPPYGFTTNVGQHYPQGPYMQPPTGPPGYNYQPGYNQPQPGYVSGHPVYPPSSPGYPSVPTVPSVSHPGQTGAVTVQPQGNTTVVVLGNCPTCRSGVLEDSYTCLGVCCAIVCFPIGILCCLAMKEKKCVRCNATF